MQEDLQLVNTPSFSSLAEVSKLATLSPLLSTRLKQLCDVAAFHPWLRNRGCVDWILV